MRLPDIAFGPVASAVAPAEAQKAEAIRGFSDTLNKGFAEYGKELVRIQQEEAATKVAEELNRTELDLKAKKYVTAQELRDSFGGQVPPHLQDKLQMADPATGELVDNQQIPMWAVADSLFQHRAQQAVTRAAQGIGAGGWQEDFKARVAPAVISRGMKVAEFNLHAADHYMQQTELQTIDRKVNAGDFDGAKKQLSESRVLAPEKKQEIFAAIESAKQSRPAIEATISEDPAVMKAQIDRLRSDPAAIAAIPEDKRKTFITHLESRFEKYQAIGVAQASFAAGVKPGSRVLDEDAVFATLNKEIAGKPFALQRDARELVKQRIADFTEQRKSETSKVFARALQQFQSPGADGRPRMSTAFIGDQERAYLMDPANGREAAELWDSMLRKEEASQTHRRQLASMPTEANWKNYGALVKDMQEHPSTYRAMSGDRFTSEVYAKLGPLVDKAMTLYKSATEQQPDKRTLSDSERRALLEELPAEYRPSKVTNPDSIRAQVWDVIQERVGDRKAAEWDEKKGAVPPTILKRWVVEEWAATTVKGGKLWGLLDRTAPKAVLEGEKRAAAKKSIGATPAPATSTPAVGTRVPSEQLGFLPGGTFELQPSGKYKRVQ